MALAGQTVGVLGVGTMGSGIVETLARAGFQVIGVDADRAASEAGIGRVHRSLARAVAAGKLSEAERAAALERVRITTEPDDLSSAHVIIEAIPENLELKAAAFSRLNDVCPSETVFATNTSALSVRELAVRSGRPERFLGTHWFNPVPVTAVVELIPTVFTDASALEVVTELVECAGKAPVVLGDRSGFISTSLLFGYLNAALRMYEQHYATREDIDVAMRLGCGHPMGPLALIDLIGLDTTYDVLDVLHRAGGNTTLAPAPLLRHLIAAGRTGRKVGHGIYRYDGPDSGRALDSSETQVVAGTPREIGRVGVIGSGTMATGIIEVFAKSGYDVRFHARTRTRVDEVHAAVRRSLDRQLGRGRISEAEHSATLNRISGTDQLDELSDRQLVVEAVVEDLEVKVALFAELDRVTRPGTILASTTSSLPIIRCAQATSRPQDVVGMHWFNPAAVMRLIEVVPTVATDPDVVATVVRLSEALGKHPVLCGDRAGFIVNALLFPYLNEAIRLLESHYTGITEIERVMQAGCGHPMGPFALLDIVGLDVTLAIDQALHEEFRDPTLAPAQSVRQLVQAGHLGRKTGRGFVDYAAG